MKNKIHVFTDADLDGTISYLTTCWFFGERLPVTPTNVKTFREDYIKFAEKNSISDFKKIIILDVDITPHFDIVDSDNITIFDHHQSSFSYSDTNGNKCKKFFKEEGSTCKLLYNTLKEKYKNVDQLIDDPKKILISLGHDYDSYTLKNKDLSLGLNTIFWNLQGNRVEKFSDRFYEGFKGLTLEDKKIIAFYRSKLEKFIQETPIFTGQVSIGGKDTKIASIMADFSINEVAQEIIEKTGSEVGIVINPKSESVTFRRAKISKINLGKLAEKLCGGNGHECAAGGKITTTFLEFTKLLNTIERYV